MSDLDGLVKRLEKRADDDRKIQANNEVVAAALKGQRLLFDQGFRSDPNTFAVRLALDYDRCAKNDAKLADDWAEAAAAIRELQAERDRLRDALMRVDARGDKMIWGEDYEVRAAFDDMADIARAALATPPKSGT